jgi:hypothetical protein
MSSGTLSGLGSQVVNFGSIVFDTSAAWLIEGNTAGGARCHEVGVGLGTGLAWLGHSQATDEHRSATDHIARQVNAEDSRDRQLRALAYFPAQK